MLDQIRPHGLGHWGSDGNAASMARNTGGLLIGADTLVGNSARVGVVAGYGHSNFDVGDRNSAGNSADYHLGIYSGGAVGDFSVRTGVAYTWHTISTNRTAAFPGFSNNLESDYRAGTTQAFGELAYRLQQDGITFEPFANLAYVNLTTDGFTETGGPAALSSSGGTNSAAFTTLGLRATTKFNLQNGVEASAHGIVGWRQLIGQTAPMSTHSFAGGTDFTIAGVPLAPSAALVEAGIDFRLQPSTNLSFRYGGEFGSGFIDQSIKATLSVKLQ
ncbi:autotransporter outer membrane beta-barrel domain-containing protein [Mesorhizobium sp. NBSH29]|uniref:autotransporter outer membrane beta-barrel domain-containing protein n=1 Tax=Mesorhizobium sp. NBSH29 TaxID=2654249 RepID=UPI0018966CFE|nr:autotransporter domain-containing protein [Mesorhizobium sp. NBSH29]